MAKETMKTDRDLNATSQLIRVIRGEAYSMPQDGLSKKGEPIVIHTDHVGWWRWGKILILILIGCMISFTVLSVSFFLGEIRNLESVRNELLNEQKQIESPPEPITLWEQKEKLAERIDSLSSFLSAQRPYISSLIKEISYIFPKNCFLNRLHIFVPSHEFSDHGTTLTIEATLVDNTPFREADLSKVIKSIEASPLFTQIRVGYQDRSVLFNYRTIDFQLDFSLE